MNSIEMVNGYDSKYEPYIREIYTENGIRYRNLDFLGFIGYRVGEDGSIWSRKRNISLGYGKGTLSGLGEKWKKLKPQVNKSYKDRNKGLLIDLCVEGKVTKLQVHRIVLLAFVGPCPEGMECCHNDGNGHNNHLTNLRWDTRKENQADRILHGTDIRGEDHGMSKLTEEKVRKIKKMYATGNYTKTELAPIFNVSRWTIGLVIREKVWKHVV